MDVTYRDTRDAYAELAHAETCAHQAAEDLAYPDPFEGRDQAADIRAYFTYRDRAYNARVAAARATGFLALDCDDHGANLSEVVARFSRRLVMSAPPRRVTPQFWGPEVGDVWATRHGWTWSREGEVMVSRDTGGEPCRMTVGLFRHEEPVLVSRGGGCFLWVPVLRGRFPEGARVAGPAGQRGTVALPPAGEVRPGVVGPWWPSGGPLEASHVWVVVDGEASGVWVPVSHLR